jgi:hypothetical protein
MQDGMGTRCQTGSAERILGRSIGVIIIVGPGAEAAGVVDNHFALLACSVRSPRRPVSAFAYVIKSILPTRRSTLCVKKR